ncbi:unnamed protein product [Caenorhabditis auriculariae]|uniref:Uncharacterized protein n=1 Tax=Caenorhabditis auriculariae TaxID=2777116 RepID=A0A8S1HW29_9PELO|nr:unnamed protein product [Caenorhabditis auriculariae]
MGNNLDTDFLRANHSMEDQDQVGNQRDFEREKGQVGFFCKIWALSASQDRVMSIQRTRTITRKKRMERRILGEARDDQPHFGRSNSGGVDSRNRKRERELSVQPRFGWKNENCRKVLMEVKQQEMILVGMVIASPRSTFETVRLFFRRPNLAKGRKTNAKEDMVVTDRLQAEVYRKRLLCEEEPDSDKVSRSREQSGASNSRCLRATCSRRAKDLTAMFVGMVIPHH